MQSMPYYQQQGYQTPYQNTVLNNAPMLTHPNGLPPMQPGMSDSVTNAPTNSSPKRKQVKNACSKSLKLLYSSFIHSFYYKSQLSKGL
jgi:hypothetical protein